MEISVDWCSLLFLRLDFRGLCHAQRRRLQVDGAAFEVYNQLGYGTAEEVYQQSLEIELALCGIAFRTKAQLVMSYKGHVLETKYCPDLFVFEAIVVELKAVSRRDR